MSEKIREKFRTFNDIIVVIALFLSLVCITRVTNYTIDTYNDNKNFELVIPNTENNEVKN